MESLGWSVEVVSSNQQTPDGVLPFHNVVATLDPDAPRRLVLACHYDSLKKPEGFLGATDSAVPCSQMINLAYTLRRDLFDDMERVSERDRKAERRSSSDGARGGLVEFSPINAEREGHLSPHFDRPLLITASRMQRLIFGHLITFSFIG